ncbi:hypothetical protein F5Y08DRAFT_191012 [Xylaria arbuscula]|nr:hypothetical protein F5Y08DRAFT_191012 [Xylaria arbuscula]
MQPSQSKAYATERSSLSTREVIAARKHLDPNSSAAARYAAYKIAKAKLQDIKHLKARLTHLEELQRKEDINEQEPIVQTKREILAIIEEVLTLEAATSNNKLELAVALPEILAWYIDGMGLSREGMRFDRDWMPVDREITTKFAQAIAGNITQYREKGQLEYVASVLGRRDWGVSTKDEYLVYQAFEIIAKRLSETLKSSQA